MQHRTVCVVALSLLAGCATITPQEYASRVRAGSSMDLCMNLGRGPYPGMITQELQRRGENCQQYAAAMQAQAAQRAAATQAALQYMQMTRPAPLPMPAPPVSCTSYRSGNTVQTDCR